MIPSGRINYNYLHFALEVFFFRVYSDKFEYICVTCVTCIYTADERLNRRKGSRSYTCICNQAVAKNLKKFRLERDLNP